MRDNGNKPARPGRLRRLIGNNKGFTILEVLVSVTTLALISGFLLQMFIVAANANEKARNMDAASSKAIEVIESFKSMDAPLSSLTDTRHFETSFDINWKELEKGKEKTARFVMYTDFDADGADTLERITVQIVDLKLNAEPDGMGRLRNVLAEYSTRKYFPDYAEVAR